MKSIKIRGMYRLPLVLIIGLIIGIPLVSWLFFIGIRDSAAVLVGAGILFFLIICVGLGFFINYGVSISEKRVVLIDDGLFKVFRREDIVAFTVIVSKKCMRVELKVRGEKPYKFCFGEFNLDHGAVILPRLWVVKYRISDQYIEKLKSKFEGVEGVKLVVMPDKS